MVYILSRVIIFIVWVLKWTLIKTRLILPAMFAAVTLGFFDNWYSTNETLAHALFTLVTAGVAVSWIVTLVNTVKSNRRWTKCDVAYAYRISGEPMTAKKRVNG